jgi:Tfp pilus assembly protein PilF
MEKFIKEQPDLPHAQEYLAALYGRTGKADAAEKLLNDILAKDPKRLTAYRELVSIYGVQNRRDRIEPLLQKGLQQSPDDIGLTIMLAEHYQLGGRDQDALTQYEKLMKLQPDSQSIKNNLALLLVDKFPSEANLQRAQQLTADFSTSSNPLYLDTAGWVQYKLKNLPQAISLLESAVAKRPLPELRYHLGMAYLQNNMKSQAKEQLSKATETPAKFPGREVAEAELAKL